MATPPSLKQLEERIVDRPISHLLWSPKMDIIAVASVHNDVSLYRLNWQKVYINGPFGFGPLVIRVILVLLSFSCCVKIIVCFRSIEDLILLNGTSPHYVVRTTAEK